MDKKEVEYFLKYLIEFFLYMQDELDLSEQEDVLQEKEEKKYLESYEEEYVSLAEFFIATRICAQNTIDRLLSEDEELFRVCAKFENGKYFIKPNAMLNYLAVHGSDKMKNRIRNYFLNQEQKVFPKCYC